MERTRAEVPPLQISARVLLVSNQFSRTPNVG